MWFATLSRSTACVRYCSCYVRACVCAVCAVCRVRKRLFHIGRPDATPHSAFRPRPTPSHFAVLETDGPYMAPKPYRGAIAYPGHCLMVAQQIADLKEVTLDDVLEITRENTRRMYGV